MVPFDFVGKGGRSNISFFAAFGVVLVFTTTGLGEGLDAVEEARVFEVFAVGFVEGLGAIQVAVFEMFAVGVEGLETLSEAVFLDVLAALVSLSGLPVDLVLEVVLADVVEGLGVICPVGVLEVEGSTNPPSSLLHLSDGHTQTSTSPFSSKTQKLFSPIAK